MIDRWSDCNDVSDWWAKDHLDRGARAGWASEVSWEVDCRSDETRYESFLLIFFTYFHVFTVIKI